MCIFPYVLIALLIHELSYRCFGAVYALKLPPNQVLAAFGPREMFFNLGNVFLIWVRPAGGLGNVFLIWVMFFNLGNVFLIWGFS